ncbi:MAG: c-type cytochrome [Bdellovibrionaceae bacterium]|nr:c-type cytochrome [Bdellovibrionales bacterium]MCB9085941.1 c-type cytochrome [Pseudobdellovibrionaceae bacterium]
MNFSDRPTLAGFLSIFVLFVLFVLPQTGCHPNGPHKPVVQSTIGSGAPGEKMNFEEVSGLFKVRCSRCHPSVSAPDWSIKEQAEAYVSNGKLYKRVIEQKTMPQPGSPEASAMNDEERSLILDWIRSVSSPDGGGPGNPPPPPPSKLAVLETCLNCHGGELGFPGQVGTPSLEGLSESYLSDQLKAFASGERRSPSMEGVASSLTRDEVKYLANHFSRLSRQARPWPGSIENVRAKVRAGEELATTYGCLGCHGSEGARANPMYPLLVGQDVQYTSSQLTAFLSGGRPGMLMPAILSGMDPSPTEDDMENLAVYFKSLLVSESQ